jgi:uncharacterized protein
LRVPLRRVLDEPAATAAGSAVFGLWHIRPTAEALAVSRLAAGRGARVLTVTAVVGGTAGAGAVLALLRERSGSLAAPVLLHLAANGAGLLASALAWPTDDWPTTATEEIKAEAHGRPGTGWRPNEPGARPR